MKQIIAAAFLLLTFVGNPVQAQTFDNLEEERIKKLALEAILEQPEIIELAYQRLQQIRQEEEQKEVLAFLANRTLDFEHDPNAPVIGNPSGDVTIVEFFDYNCPYCKRATDVVDRLLEDDSNIRLVYREWPILSEGSVFAARAALAARKQNKYAEMHKALMSASRVDETVSIQIAKDLNLDIEKLRADMEGAEVDAHIRLSMELAQGLKINGTPTFVVGDFVGPGLIPYEQLAEAVANQRRKEK